MHHSAICGNLNASDTHFFYQDVLKNRRFVSLLGKHLSPDESVAGDTTDAFSFSMLIFLLLIYPSVSCVLCVRETRSKLNSRGSWSWSSCIRLDYRSFLRSCSGTSKNRRWPNKNWSSIRSKHSLLKLAAASGRSGSESHPRALRVDVFSCVPARS